MSESPDDTLEIEVDWAQAEKAMKYRATAIYRQRARLFTGMIDIKERDRDYDIPPIIEILWTAA